MRCTPVVVVLLSVSAVASADRPLDIMHPVTIAPGSVPALVNSHILYLNRCTGGCMVTSGTTDARTNHSDIVSGGTHTLSAYSFGDASWESVVTCIQAVEAPFNITVTDVAPTSGDFFEVMIGGSPTDVGLPNGVGGIADYACSAPGECSSSYIPDALVFDFAAVYGSGATGVTYTCGTAAQEIAHAWTLDHATGTSDPMTYNNYSTPLHYRDAAPCGSDCDYSCPGGSGSCNAFGVSCTGTGTSGTHVCLSTGNATQDEVKIITALFGPAGAKPPTVAITSPATGSAQQSGFKIDVTCTSSDSTVQEVDLSIDGAPSATLTTAPFTFDSGTLADGTHVISVVCATKLQATATATATVIVGEKCTADTDCTKAGYICYESACIAGPMATGGLGSTCTGNSICSSGSCASDGSEMLCVVPCDLNNDMCPDGFGCLMAGAGGVCWLGAPKGGGSGCCQAGNDGAAGSILLGIALGGMLVTRRKRR